MGDLQAWDRAFEMDWSLVGSKQGLVKALGGAEVLDHLKVVGPPEAASLPESGRSP